MLVMVAVIGVLTFGCLKEPLGTIDLELALKTAPFVKLLRDSLQLKTTNNEYVDDKPNLLVSVIDIVLFVGYSKY